MYIESNISWPGWVPRRAEVRPVVDAGGVRVDDERAGALCIDAEELARRLMVSQRSLYRLVAAGDIPPPLKLGASGAMVRWFWPGVVERMEQKSAAAVAESMKLRLRQAHCRQVVAAMREPAKGKRVNAVG